MMKNSNWINYIILKAILKRMTDVSTYRTERGEELRKLAEKQNISISQLTSEIINNYLEYPCLDFLFKDVRQILK
jgi:hypothetical protein